MQDSSKIYIDIQSLLEIRQSTLTHFLGEKETLEYIYKEEYYMRSTDEFAVDTSAYKAIAETDSSLALSKATITYMLVVLNSKLA